MQEKWTKDNCIEMGLKDWEDQIDKRCSNLFRESATPWSKLYSDYNASSFNVLDHLMKMFYFRNFEVYVRGWVITCFKYYKYVPICKSNNKPPRKEQLFDCLWENKEDTFEGYHKATVDELNSTLEHFPKIRRICSNEVYNFCQDYMMWVSYMLGEKHEGLTETSAYLAIRDLLEKYPLPKGVF